MTRPQPTPTSATLFNLNDQSIPQQINQGAGSKTVTTYRAGRGCTKLGFCSNEKEAVFQSTLRNLITTCSRRSSVYTTKPREDSDVVDIHGNGTLMRQLHL
jgi:hypothetical protein